MEYIEDESVGSYIYLKLGKKNDIINVIKRILRERMMLRMIVSVPGMPCVYYADEAGLEGCADPFCRRTLRK